MEYYSKISHRVGVMLRKTIRESKHSSFLAMALYYTIQNHRDIKLRYATLSREKLKKEFGCTDNTLSRALQLLESNGFIFVLRTPRQYNKFFTPYEDICLDPKMLDKYPLIIQNVGKEGDLDLWSKYDREFLFKFKSGIAVSK